MNKRICAVVVTFNRKQLLEKCISSIRMQSRSVDAIVVINNSSGGETQNWLKEQSDLIVITQNNSGGGGGFFSGILFAYDKGFDYIWCLDDDCIALPETLRNLMPAGPENFVRNSLILAETDRSEFAFGFYDYQEAEYYDSAEQVIDKTILHGAGFFNSTLLPRNIVAKAGYPNPDFFIYGDEYEYYLRILDMGIDVITFTSSIVLHPSQKYKYIGKGRLFHRYNYYRKISAEYFPRNLMAISYFYNQVNYRRVVKTFLFDLLGLLLIQKNFVLILIYIKSILKGPQFIRELKSKKYFRALDE